MRTDLTCLSQVPENVNFVFQVASARWECNAEGDFSRSCVKFNDPLRSGLVDVGPHYALFFYLLRDTSVDAYMQFAWAVSCRMVVSLTLTCKE